MPDEIDLTGEEQRDLDEVSLRIAREELERRRGERDKEQPADH
jgi:hypothetical protein